VVATAEQEELAHAHPEEVHNPSFDCEELPVLQVCKS
jgi:hypothetical protein